MTLPRVGKQVKHYLKLNSIIDKCGCTCEMFSCVVFSYHFFGILMKIFDKNSASAILRLDAPAIIRHQKTTTLFPFPNPKNACVRIDRSNDGRMQIMNRKVVPHVLFFKIWRCSEILSYRELTPIPTCRYHYGCVFLKEKIFWFFFCNFLYYFFNFKDATDHKGD